MSEDNLERPKFSRRKAFKAATIGLTGLGLTKVVAEKIHPVEQGVDTPYAFFFPIYWKHSKGAEVQPEDIPDNIDILFDELVTREIFTLKREALLNESFGKPETYSKIINHTKVMYGDIDAPPSREVIGAVWIMKTLSGIALLKTAASMETKKTKRRQFLKAALAAGGVYGISELALMGLSFNIGQINNSHNQKEVLSRIMYRIQGMESNFHSEDTIVFFRNLIWAHKLLDIGEKTFKEKGSKPRIAIHCGSLHSGIEDLLMAGKGVCEYLILLYPNVLLNAAVENMGGIQNFSSSRIIDSSSDTTVIDLDLLEALIKKLL